MKLLGKEYSNVTRIYREGLSVVIERGEFELRLDNFESLLHEYNKTNHQDKPETLSQSRNWQKINSRYKELGFCEECAAQAAYGHQNGFSRVWPPCKKCSLLCRKLPVEALNGWRRRERGHTRLAE